MYLHMIYQSSFSKWFIRLEFWYVFVELINVAACPFFRKAKIRQCAYTMRLVVVSNLLNKNNNFYNLKINSFLKKKLFAQALWDMGPKNLIDQYEVQIELKILTYQLHILQTGYYNIQTSTFVIYAPFFMKNSYLY